tara:strand:+ start:1175 stop:1396 length:222 start_codon:yes stop_codon:yes gene_type:complete
MHSTNARNGLKKSPFSVKTGKMAMQNKGLPWKKCVLSANLSDCFWNFTSIPEWLMAISTSARNAPKLMQIPIV